MSATTRQFIKYQVKETKENKMFLLLPRDFDEAKDLKDQGNTIEQIFERLTGADASKVTLIIIKQEIV